MIIILYIVKIDKYMEFQVDEDCRWYNVAQNLVENKLIEKMNNIGIYQEAKDYYTENLNELVRSICSELYNQNIFYILEGPLRNKCISEIYEDQICMPTPQVLKIFLIGQIEKEIEVNTSMYISDLKKEIENAHNISNFSLNLMRNDREIDICSKKYENQKLGLFQLENGENLRISQKQQQSHQQLEQQSDEQQISLQQFKCMPQCQYYEEEIQFSQYVETQLTIYIHDGNFTKTLNYNCCLVNTTIQNLADAVEIFLSLSKFYAIPEIYINGKIKRNSSILHELQIDQNTLIESKIRYSGGCTIWDNQGNNQQSEFMNFIYTFVVSEGIRVIFQKQGNIAGDLLTIIT